MAYSAPQSIPEVLQKIEFEEALELDDPRYVDTRAARGSERTLARLARKFGLSLTDGSFYPATTRHVLFFGHTGSGKTTELRHYGKELGGKDRFFVVEVDVANVLDRNNLKYADLLMATAQQLMWALQQADVAAPVDAVKLLEDWFKEHVITRGNSTELSAALQTGVEVKSGIPFVGSLFAKFTAAFKANATYKEELRTIVRNSFTQFAATFNSFLRGVEKALQTAGKGQRVLFIIDGTDKLRGEDTHNLFVQDAEQLLAIEAAIVYTAPISLLYEGSLTNKLDADLVLPMIKLTEHDKTPAVAGRQALREILLKRAAVSLFNSNAEIDGLVDASGGHPRELLRLLKLACEVADDNIDARAVSEAIRLLAANYRYFLEPDDYTVLAAADRDSTHLGTDERTRKLLYHTALLAYNDGSWRASLPAVRTLEGYKKAQAAAAATAALQPGD
jgi:Cdc6-like AAA superfamily ATPase